MYTIFYRTHMLDREGDTLEPSKKEAPLRDQSIVQRALAWMMTTRNGKIATLLGGVALMGGELYAIDARYEHDKRVQLADVEGIEVKEDDLGNGKWRLIFPSNKPFTPIQVINAERAFMRKHEIPYIKSAEYSKEYSNTEGEWSNKPWDETTACIIAEREKE